jgi:hypothetical protein
MIPAAIPISRYSTLHTIENTYPGGVSDDIVRLGYHRIIDSACKSMEKYPTRKEIIINSSIGVKRFI